MPHVEGPKYNESNFKFSTHTEEISLLPQIQSVKRSLSTPTVRFHERLVTATKRLRVTEHVGGATIWDNYEKPSKFGSFR